MGVADWYKQAILKTRQRDIANEARATGRLALLYDQVIKDPIRARNYLMAAVELGLSLEGVRSFEAETWWRTCQSRLRQIVNSEQEKTVSEEILKKLAPQMKKIRDAAAAVVPGSACGYPEKLLALLWEEFPPLYPTDLIDPNTGEIKDKSDRRAPPEGDLKNAATLK